MSEKFITVDTEKWQNSPYVPQSNAAADTAKGHDNNSVPCWYINSNAGRWTTLVADFGDIDAGDEITFSFWAKYSGTPHTFNVEIMHSDYEKRTTHNLSASSPYCVCKDNGWRLFSVRQTAKESGKATIGINIFGCIMTILPALPGDEKAMTENRSVKGQISKLHPVVTLMKGENYGFCGCMAYLADCLGLDVSVFDFHYFAMATGDIFTQLHIDDLCDCTDCVSDYLFANDIVYKAYSAIGYAYEYLDKDMIQSDKAAAFGKIKASIDNDVPVISVGFEGGYDSCIICGYTDDGSLKIMLKENDEPLLQKDLPSFSRGLVFTGEYRHDMNLSQQFCSTVRSIYDCVTRKPERGCTFGKAAFKAWADSLTNGGIRDAKIVDSWCSYGYSLCMAGTNGYAGSPMLKDMIAKCPEFEQTKAYSLLKKVCEQFDAQNAVFCELMEKGYGFDIPEEKLRDVEFMRPAAGIIMKLCDICDSIAALYTDKLLSDEDFWSADPYRIVKCYKEQLPAMRFVGICYKNSDRVDGMFGYYWGKFHEEGRFDALEPLLTEEFKASYPEAGDYIGLMKNKDGAPDDYFEYWIGMFLPPDCEVPEGYGYIDIKHDCAGICWIKGKEDDVFCREGECYCKLTQSGMSVPSEEDGGCYMFERYGCPRFTTPDEYGEVILDLGFFVEKEKPIKDLSELKPTGDGETDSLEYFNLPNARVIGLSMRCPLDMTAANPIPAFWGKCDQDGLFDTIKGMPRLISGMLGFTDDFDSKTNTFLYICGILCPAGTPVPEGYTFRDIPATIVSKGRYGEWLGDCKPIWDIDGFAWGDEPGQFWNSELYIDGEDNDRGFRLLCSVRRK